MDENQIVEFKSKWNDEYLKILASFANTDGGKLYIGIDDSLPKKKAQSAIISLKSKLTGLLRRSKLCPNKMK